MRIRGALHVHSTLSRDGSMTIAELARYFKQKGYQFLAMGEHAEDLDEAKVQALREQSAANSDDQFCVIPGIEFAVTRQIHIVGIGVVNLIRLESPVYVAEQIRKQGGMSILAHPKRLGWNCPPEVLLAVDAAEIWNIGYDGKYLPSAKSLPAFERMQEINPKLLAIASHDFHRTASFYDVAIEMDAPMLAPDPILQNLKGGSYRVRSTFFNCDHHGRVSAGCRARSTCERSIGENPKSTIGFCAANGMKKFTILHTIETAGPGGAETVVLDLASRVNSSRFRSIVLLPREDWLSKNLKERGIPTFFVDSKAWHDFRLPRGMSRIIRQEKVDLIHSHLPGQNFYSCAVGRLTGPKTIATYHGALESAQSQGMRGKIQLGTVRRTADAVVVVCDFMGKMLQDIKFPPEKIVRIYNGIKVGRYEVPSDGRLRRELGLYNGTKIVGTVANLRQTKGYEFLVQAAGKVLATAPDTRFVAIGDINQEIAKPLYESIERLGIEDRFHFLGFRKDIPELLKEFDVFVLASVSEGFPLVALEAMAASRPMVVTRSGGPQEIIDDGRNGLLVPPADSNALAGKISELLGDPQRATELAKSALLKVSTTFSIEKMISEYESLYERLLNGGKAQ